MQSDSFVSHIQLLLVAIYILDHCEASMMGHATSHELPAPVSSTDVEGLQIQHRHDPTIRPKNFRDLSAWGKTTNTVSRYSKVSQKAYDKFCVWAGPIGLGFFFLLFPTGSFLPPIPPSRTAEQVLDHYRRHESGIQGGAALMQFAGCFYSFYIGIISSQMSRIPGVTHGKSCSLRICGVHFLSNAELSPQI